MNNNLYLDIHVLQNVPPCCINRDDTGSPKTAKYGGAVRARVSSQSWKHEMRKMFTEIVGEQNVGIRTKKIVEMIADEIKKINEQLEDSKGQLEQAYLDMIQTLRYTVEAKDSYTRGHSDRVSEYSVLIGEKVGLSEDQIKTLRIGGLFHDIGKIGIPDSILQKQAKLTDEEYSEIKNHP